LRFIVVGDAIAALTLVRFFLSAGSFDLGWWQAAQRCCSQASGRGKANGAATRPDDPPTGATEDHGRAYRVAARSTAGIVRLRSIVHTEGNLGTQIATLERAGYILVERDFNGGAPESV